MKGALKDEELLLSILKAKLTKKEYKLLLWEVDKTDKDAFLKKLNLTPQRFDAIYSSMSKKLNSEKLKQLLYAV